MIWGRDDAPLFDLVPFDFDNNQYDQEISDANGGHVGQVFGNCSSDCVARIISTLVNCGDEDPRRAIAQIYNASFTDA